MSLRAIPATFAFVAPVSRAASTSGGRHSVSGRRYAAVIACLRGDCSRIGGAKAANGRGVSRSELERGSVDISDLFDGSAREFLRSQHYPERLSYPL